MKKTLDFVKKHYMLCICIISAILLVFVFPRLEKKGTFSLSASPSVTIECPNTATKGATINCNIKLNPDGEKILSVNANYDLAEGVTYVAFSAKNDFENYAVDEENIASSNGFAVINLEGVTSEVVVGTLTVKLPDEATDNTSYTIGLKTIELSNDEPEMVDPENSTASDSVLIVAESDEDILEINDLDVDEDNMLITRIVVGTTYGSFKEHFTTNGTITLISNDDATLTDSDIVKTGDKIRIELSHETKTYTLSALGDILGNGIIGINDVGTLYRYYRNRTTLTDDAIAAGDIFNDGSVEMGDIGRLYRYYRNRVDTLEESD